jgi:hypothetical protein
VNVASPDSSSKFAAARRTADSHHFLVAVHSSHLLWCFAVFVASREVGATCDESTRHFDVAEARSIMQCCVAIHILQVHTQSAPEHWLL